MNEDLCYKYFFMTRYFFISIFLLALFATSSNNVYAKSFKHTRITVATNSTREQNEQKALPVQAAAPKTSTRATAPEETPEHKAHGPKMEEVPHIHHFHKERVKRSKRHHKKIWTMSKLLLLLCHIALLVMAYTHAAH